MSSRINGRERHTDFDLTKPDTRRRKRRPLERDLEDKCRDYAHSLGWLSRKMNGLGFVAWPDRYFIRPEIPKPPRGHKGGPYLPSAKAAARPNFWVEFKREGEEPTVLQLKIHGWLRRRGETVLVFDTFAAFKEYIDARTA